MRLSCSWSGSVRALLDSGAGAIDATLLREALACVPGAGAWWLAIGVRLLRVGRTIDAVLVSDRAIVVLLVRPGPSFTAAHRQEAEDAALDLADFHRGSRLVPIVPVVVVPHGAQVRAQFPLPLSGATSVMEASRLTLPSLLQQIARFPPLGRRPAEWETAGYAPVPGLIAAACLLYATHDVGSLLLAEAGPDGLVRTRAVIARAIGVAQAGGGKHVVFVTGAPGAGKTLCGLDLAFSPGADALFLTGNPTLVHVLRAALVRDAVARGTERRAAARRMAAVIQALPPFRDHHVAHGDAPSERLLVIDEAQRCWSAPQAIRKTRNRAVPLGQSEPALLLDIMARRPGWAVMVCLLGGGQEIHDGEGGLAAWGEALAARPGWHAWAPDTRALPDARQRLPALASLTVVPDLHLAAPIRAVRAPLAAAWVNAVLDDLPLRAAEIARQGGAPFRVTRSLAAMRAALRQRGTRTAGLLASSTARRLRAEGLGAVLPHQDEDLVARWFLDRWPDIRSSDALEVVASEFAVQGLELDRAGLCWDADLVRGEDGWVARRFRASQWTRASADAALDRRNAYRVLLTRARHGTVIWVPCGDRRDRTRDPALYDGIVAYLHACGAEALDGEDARAEDAPTRTETLLL